MRVRLKYYGIPITGLSHKEQIVVIQPATTIAELINILNDSIEGRTEHLARAATFLVNQQSADKNTVLNEDDEIIIMYGLAGG